MKHLTIKQQPQRWITQIDNGKVKLVQRIESDAVVISINKIADLCANSEIVSDEIAQLIMNAIKTR